jgi:hypothetical protein
MSTGDVFARITLLLGLGALGACASAPSRPEALVPWTTYTEALVALDAGNHTDGRARLAQVLETCGTTGLGERALVALVADVLDPRNPDLDLAASLSRAYLSQPYRTPWTEQLMASAYLVSLDVGGRLDPSVAMLPSAEPGSFPVPCQNGLEEPRDRGALDIPELPAPSMASRLAELELSREALQTELSRVRETLRP